MEKVKPTEVFNKTDGVNKRLNKTHGKHKENNFQTIMTIIEN